MGRGFGFSPQVTGHIGARLPVQSFRGWRRNAGRGRAREFEAPVRERMVVSLNDVADLDGAAVVARDREANGVGPAIPFTGGETRAGAPGVAQVAERRE